MLGKSSLAQGRQLSPRRVYLSVTENPTGTDSGSYSGGLDRELGGGPLAPSSLPELRRWMATGEGQPTFLLEGSGSPSGRVCDLRSPGTKRLRGSSHQRKSCQVLVVEGPAKEQPEGPPSVHTIRDGFYTRARSKSMEPAWNSSPVSRKDFLLLSTPSSPCSNPRRVSVGRWWVGQKGRRRGKS